MLLRRLFISVFICFIIFGSAFAQEAPSVLAPHVLIVDLTTKEILFEKDSEQKVPIASLTKLMVSLLTLENLDLKEVVPISQISAATPGSTAQLEIGERFYVADLLLGLLMSSGNDAAVALAEYYAGTEIGFVTIMNQKALELNLQNTHYGNVTGFDGAGGYSSASDLSVLAQKLLTYEFFRKVIQTSNTNILTIEGLSHYLINTNQFLGVTISGLTVTGMKTGTTLEAGECLMILAQDENGHEVLIILLGSTDRYSEAKILLTWIGENFELGRTQNFVPQIDPTISLPAWPFPDISTYTPYFFETVSDLKTQGIIHGDDFTGLLRGNDPLNRAEMVTLLLRSEGYDTSEKIAACVNPENNISTVFFSDVSPDAWYAKSIQCATKLGWVTGDDLSMEAEQGTLPTFRPGDRVNLPEALKLIVEAQNDLLDSDFNGENWYDVYINFLFEANILKKENQTNEYLFTHIPYSLGEINDSIARVAVFELLHRLGSIEQGATFPYQPYLSLEDYQASGAIIKLHDDKLYISDPQLGFELSALPMGQFELSDLSFYIKNPSGSVSDYYTDWSIIYPTLEGKSDAELIHLFIYDPDYLQAFDSVENKLKFKLSCVDRLVDDPKLASLYLYLCPQGNISEKIEINEYQAPLSI